MHGLEEEDVAFSRDFLRRNLFTGRLRISWRPFVEPPPGVPISLAPSASGPNSITLARYLNGHGNFVLVVQAFKQP
jgi:hypothetical protein